MELKVYPHASFGFHVGVEGNEQVDILAKGTLKIKHVDLKTPLTKDEAKTFIRTYAQSVWQEHWDHSETGWHLYNVLTRDRLVLGGWWAGNLGKKI